jgi:hypothetical protein
VFKCVISKRKSRDGKSSAHSCVCDFSGAGHSHAARLTACWEGVLRVGFKQAAMGALR